MSDKPGKRYSARKFALLVLALIVLYLGFYPVPIDPVAWSPPPAPGFTGRFAPTLDVSATRRLAADAIGPEALTFDASGHLFAGLLDGRIVRIDPNGTITTFVDTGGRPLGMVFAPDGSLVVADAYRGLLEIAPDRTVRVLVDSYRGRRFGFPDDVDRLPDGRILFTDASDRFGLDHWNLDIVEHRPGGRVFVYDPSTRRTDQLARGFFFANGIAVAADGSFALVCETGAYRVDRLELAGAGIGSRRTILENLPGFCDNIRRSEDGRSFFVAIPSPRNPILDATASMPALRRAIVRLPRWMQPAPKEYTTFIRIDGEGRVLGLAHRTESGAYGPVTTALDHAGTIYLGSLSGRGVGVVPAPRR